MRARIKILLPALAILLLLAGCQNAASSDTSRGDLLSPEKISQEDPSSSQSVDAPTGEDENLPPRDGMARSRLTNEWVDEKVAETRPIAVLIPNEAHATPHYNLSKASVIYEAKVEGSMTRMMAIYEDWQKLNKIGNIRSVRRYFAYWAFEWDSIIVHFGGPYFVYELLNLDTTDNVDGSYDSTAFFRTSDREQPHNAYASGPGILEVIKKKQISLEYRGVTEEHHFLFADQSSPNTLTQYGENAKDATYVDMTAAYPLTRCYFDYNPDDQLYYRSQYLSGSTDGPHVDGYTDKQLCFSNIIVQRVKQEDIGDGYLAMQCHDTTRDGWYFTRGKGIHVTWEKIGDYGVTKYFDDNGDQVAMNMGKTMILIIRDTDNFTFR
ncbi:MAG: DUF3048 domain-containing protein [Lachnospiraceae bacterium]|nr:DUF3048 domain-containing protein [Lachnospiraceae bacterium]